MIMEAENLPTSPFHELFMTYILLTAICNI